MWLDVPWMIVLTDFRQGVFFCALATFWAVFVGEHRSYDNVSYWMFNDNYEIWGAAFRWSWYKRFELPLETVSSCVRWMLHSIYL